MRRWAGVLLTATLLGLGCTPRRPAVLFGRGDELLTQADYPEVLNTWTRTEQIYRGLDNSGFFTATFHAPEFRRAFAVTFPDIYGHGGTVTRRELVDLTGGVEQYHNFFLAVHTPNVRWNDLSKADSIWHLTMRGSTEAAVSAAEIISIKMDQNLREVYPYISHFDKVYIVRFPLADPLHRVIVDSTTTQFSVRIASALGVAEMTWDLGKEPPPSYNSLGP